MIRFASLAPALLGLSLLAPPALSQSLSPAELGARENLPLSQADNALRVAGCRIEGAAQAPEIALPEGPRGRYLVLPDIDILKVTEMIVSDGRTQKASVVAFKDLPHGGIWRRDFCSTIQIHYVGPHLIAGAVITSVGLWLRADLDLTGEYPITGAEALSRDQVDQVAGSGYIALNLSDPQVEAWWQAGNGRSVLRRPDAPALQIGQTLFIPLAQ